MTDEKPAEEAPTIKVKPRTKAETETLPKVESPPQKAEKQSVDCTAFREVLQRALGRSLNARTLDDEAVAYIYDDLSTMGKIASNGTISWDDARAAIQRWTYRYRK